MNICLQFSIGSFYLCICDSNAIELRTIPVQAYAVHKLKPLHDICDTYVIYIW